MSLPGYHPSQVERSLAAMVMLVEQLVTHADTLNFGDLQPSNPNPNLKPKPSPNPNPAPSPNPSPNPSPIPNPNPNPYPNQATCSRTCRTPS